MPDVTWDASFEASPADTDEAKYGATKIRQLKLAISERGELEFNWKAGTQPFVKAGKAAVVFVGTTTEIDALTGMAAGAYAWDTTLKVLKYYSDAGWVVLDIDHGALSGLGDDDHTQYLKLDKAGQTLAENLAVTDGKTIDGRDISVDGALLDTLASRGIIQVVNTQTGAVATGTTIIPYDDTIPQISEGNQYMSLAITPSNVNNKLLIQVVCNGETGQTLTAALFQDDTANALAAASGFSNNYMVSIAFNYFMTAGTTSSTTFKVRMGGSAAGTTTFNGVSGGRKFGGVLMSSITITEIKV